MDCKCVLILISISSMLIYRNAIAFRNHWSNPQFAKNWAWYFIPVVNNTKEVKSAGAGLQDDPGPGQNIYPSI